MIERMSGNTLLGIVLEYNKGNTLELSAQEFNDFPTDYKMLLLQSGFKLYDLMPLMPSLGENYFFLNPTTNDVVSSMNRQLLDYVVDGVYGE